MPNPKFNKMTIMIFIQFINQQNQADSTEANEWNENYSLIESSYWKTNQNMWNLNSEEIQMHVGT